ncbi:MAG: hypothetical protein CMJ78_27540 [Planctomycetaceae bacterium]|nr:hypothetical protein [Planctomycetaceae bacterium]
MFDLKGKKIRALLPGDEALKPRAWQHVCVRYSGGQSNSSVTILATGRSGRLRNSTETYVDAVELPEGPLKIASNLPTAGLSDLRIYRRWLADEEVDLLNHEFQLKSLMASDLDWNDLSAAHKALATNFYSANIDVGFRRRIGQLATSQLRRDYIYSRSVTTMVSEERDTEPSAWVLQRGEYDQPLEKVSPSVPAALSFNWNDWKKNAEITPPKNRLEFARWLTHPDHPLTARVMVNRLWQSVFGVGLVKTSEDFGVMGERPSHPELLDWLAVEFIESGWNMHHMLRLMLTSATYRQSGMTTAEKLKLDKDNRFLSRGPRHRMDAEMLRDQVLEVSGLLRKDMGGPSVKPYQPGGLWNVVAITGSNTRVFKKDAGDKLYRRSLYTFWKRTSPPPSMAAFDAPTREQCTVRRERTNTPLQALVLMNDTQYVEAARHLAQLTIKAAKKPKARAQWMFQRALGRPAIETDTSDMLELRDALHAVFSKNSEAAQKLIETGDSKPDKNLNPAELAAWTMVANTLLNRDDFVNK